MPRPTSAARSPSPSPPPQDLSAEAITPLGYDSEAELLEMFGRWRDELRDDLRRKWAEAGGAKSGESLEEAERKVMEVSE